MTSDEGVEEVLAADARAESDPEPRPAATIKQSPRLGRRLDTWGWVALLVAAAALGGGVDTSEGLAWADAIWFVAGLSAMLFGLWAVLHGRRHLSWVLPDLDAAPKGEGVVLFLRSFSEERGFARKVTSRPLRWLIAPLPITPSEVRTEEEQVARGVAPFGRMVALGPTSDRLPHAGANRSYASDDQWQSEILTALDKADLVLLAAGPGGQLQWEVEQAVRRDDPVRLVLLVPRARGQYADFREKLGNLFPKGLPEAPEVRASRVRYVRAVVWFDPDWTPHLELLRGRLPLLRFAARTQRALPRALQHVYERAGLQPPVKNQTTRPRPRTVTASVALFSALWVGVPALFVLFFTYLSISSGGPSESSGVTGNPTVDILLIGLLLLAPFVWWMRRVLHAGPFAILNVQALNLGFGAVTGMAAIQLMFHYSSVLAPVGLFAVPLIVVWGLLLFLPVVLLLRRDVRNWVDSRT